MQAFLKILVSLALICTLLYADAIEKLGYFRYHFKDFISHSKKPLDENLKNDMPKIIELAKQKLKSFPHEAQNTFIGFYSPIMFDKEKYFFVDILNHEYLGTRTASANVCIVGYKHIENPHSFCINAYFTHYVLVHKNNFFTLEIHNDDRYEFVDRILYLTFWLGGERFYLYQYSERIVSKESTDEEFERTRNHIDKTLIYYRQPRDDAKSKNLIPLDSINDELLERLQDECEKSGKCK